MQNSQRTPGIVPGRLDQATYRSNFDDLHPPLDAHEARVAADRCYFCHDAPCITACPTSIDIPLFMTPMMKPPTTAPMIEQCKVTMECKLIEHIAMPTHDLFVGEVVGADVRTAADRQAAHRLGARADPLAEAELRVLRARAAGAHVGVGLLVALIGILQYHGLDVLDIPAVAPPAATQVQLAEATCGKASTSSLTVAPAASEGPAFPAVIV